MNIIVNVVVQKDGKILIVQEGEGNAKGMWNFPAGHLDEGENIFDGAIREAKEETGFDVELTGIVNIQNVVYDNRHITMFMFAANIVGGELTVDGKEIMNVKFIDFDEFLNMSDSELRCADARKETLNKLIEGKVFPLEIISNYDLRTK